MKQRKRTTLKEVIPLDTGAGIFGMFISPPWETSPEIINAAYAARSAHKVISPYIENASGGEMLPPERLQHIANILAGIYYTKWEKDAYLYGLRYGRTENDDYNPIDNYNMLETITGDEKHTRKPELDRTEHEDPADTTQTKISANGSMSYHPDAEITRGGSIDREYHERGQEKIDTAKNQTLTRRGNIGVTTTAQMVTQEHELNEWLYLDTVFADIDKFLTINYYNL